MKNISVWIEMFSRTFIPIFICGACFYYKLYWAASIQLIFCFGFLFSLYKTIQEIKKEIELAENNSQFLFAMIYGYV